MKYHCIFRRGELICARRKPLPPDCGEMQWEHIAADVDEAEQDGEVRVVRYTVRRSQIDPRLVRSEPNPLTRYTDDEIQAEAERRKLTLAARTL